MDIGLPRPRGLDARRAPEFSAATERITDIFLARGVLHGAAATHDQGLTAMAAFKLEGIVAAPVLPMLPDFSIDWTSLRSYIRWIAEQKPTAIAMNMDASEGPSLEHDEQIEVLRVCGEVIAGRVPLVSGLIAGSTQAAVRWGNELKRAGAEALAVFPPFPTFLGNPVPDRDDLRVSQGDRRRRRAAADRVPVSEGVRTRLPAGHARAARDDPRGHRARRKRRSTRRRPSRRSPRRARCRASSAS